MTTATLPDLATAELKLLIGGERVDAASGERFDVLNPATGELLERMRNVLSLIANLSQEAPGRRDRSVDEHRAILDAIRAGDPDAARRATFAHLGSIEADSLGALEQFSAESAIHI